MRDRVHTKAARLAHEIETDPNGREVTCALLRRLDRSFPGIGCVARVIEETVGSDPVKRAVDVVAVRILAREATGPAERRDHRNEQLLAAYNALRPIRGRATAMLVARRFVADERDPVAVEALAKHVRRLALRRKKCAQCADEAAPSA